MRLCLINLFDPEKSSTSDRGILEIHKSLGNLGKEGIDSI